MSDYYVYVYIDPRNFEEFYLGKGQGSRKNAHLFDNSDSKKSKRIKEIQKADLQPIIRVIASKLSEHDALLIEKTLLWKLGKQLTNVSSGHYSDKFRPHNTLHTQISGFDFQNGIYYFNVGESPDRNWEDFRCYDYISAGHGVRWRDAILGFESGDVFAAYLKGHGFVGIGRIEERAKPMREALYKGQPLVTQDLTSEGAKSDLDSDELSEYVCSVTWIASVPRSEAKWEKNSGLFTTTHVRASLDNQPDTIEFLNEEFGVDLWELVL
ncbi:MAG: GIY-YIG nuclease family protein [Trueperaceae bacterium]|nr:GIY-YIG nuclease family protein [Trueperaceae bacterium]